MTHDDIIMSSYYYTVSFQFLILLTLHVWQAHHDHTGLSKHRKILPNYRFTNGIWGRSIYIYIIISDYILSIIAQLYF